MAAREDPVGERVQQDARRAAAELVNVDGAAPGQVSRVAGLGVGHHDSASRRANAIGAYHEIGGKGLTVGQRQHRGIAPVIQVRKLIRQVVVLGAEGVQQPSIQLEVRREPVGAGLLVDDRAVRIEILKPVGL